MRPDASKNGQISPLGRRSGCQDYGSRPRRQAVLSERGKSAKIHAGSGFIWRISVKRDAGIKMDHVPFRGAAPLVTEMRSGRIQFGADQLSSSLQHVRAAVATRAAAPKGTPEPVIARLHREIAAAAKHPDVRKRMTEVGAEPSGSTPAEMREMLREQVAKVRPMVNELQLVVQ